AFHPDPSILYCEPESGHPDRPLRKRHAYGRADLGDTAAGKQIGLCPAEGSAWAIKERPGRQQGFFPCTGRAVPRRSICQQALPALQRERVGIHTWLIREESLNLHDS